MFFPGRNGPARPSAAGRSRPPSHSCPSVWGTYPAHVVYQMYAAALYRATASAPGPLQPFQREVSRTVCRTSPPRTRASARCAQPFPGYTQGTSLRRLSGAARRSQCASAHTLVPLPPGPSGCVPSSARSARRHAPSARLQKPSLLACRRRLLSDSPGPVNTGRNR